MKIFIKTPNIFFPLLIIWILFNGLSLEMIAEDTCSGEELAIAQWYGQVSQFVKTNQNTSQHILDVQAKLHQLEESVAEAHKTRAESVTQTNKGTQELLEKLKQLEAHIKQIQENTNAGGSSGNIIIQRRLDGSVDFFRPWADYKLGFGNSSGEFFIGLDRLHKLTNSGPYELLVVMEDWENDRRYAKYDQFVIGSEAEKYALKQLGTYSGSAGDALAYALGQRFTTKDQDNDVYKNNCAVEFTGAWWYKDCHHSNLNGRYLKATTTEYAQGVNWHQFKGHHYSLKFVEMTIRPR